MPTYVCKHYRRSAPGAAVGALADEITFSAASSLEAETRMRKEKDFATLEDDCGHVLVTWLHGVLHA